ncbi:hypothetical protein D3C84_809350 [compost metagenome]
MALDAVELCFADDRSHGGLRVMRVTESILAHFINQIGNDLFDLGLMHQHPAWCMARLASIEEATLDIPASCLLQVGITQHDVGGFAAQLKAHALDGPRRRLAHLATCPGGAGE